MSKKKVISELEKVDITLKDTDIVRLHRSSKPTQKNGKLQAQTIVKLTYWDKRKLFKQVNKTARA